MTSARDWAAGAARFLATEQQVEPSEDLPLADFQRRAAARLVAMTARWGGALLADAVGLGKTRVLLTAGKAIAREQRSCGITGPVWCVAPARVLGAWRDGASKVGLASAEFVSFASLSRGLLPTESPSVLLIDEAHRLRNRDTRRHRRLIEYLPVPMLLATATPVVNRLSDLQVLLSLFLDDDDVREAVGWNLRTAFDLATESRWDPTELLRQVVVRRAEAPGTTEGFRRPTARLKMLPYEPGELESWFWQHLEEHVRRLSIGAAGADWPSGLFVEHVMRRWEAGPEALRETLERIEAFCVRSLQAGRHGRTLDRATFRTVFGDEPSQEVLAFVYPERLSTDDRPAALDVEQDIEVLSQLLARLDRLIETGSARDEAIVELAADGERLLVFTSFRRSAESLFKTLAARLGSAARVGLVTGAGAEATGLGRTRGHDVLRRFAPKAHGATSLRDHERLAVLVATDCIAEGVNLQDCHRVVLADLPYTPLGVEQRVGRLTRPGSGHDEVLVYLPRPRRWNDSLGMRRRLDDKLSEARRAHAAPTASVLRSSHRSGPNPLATLTALDRLAAELPRRAVPEAAYSLVEEPSVWLVLARVNDSVPAAFAVEPDGVSPSLEGVLRHLAELGWDDRALTPVEVPAIVRRAVEERQNFLRAASLAPAELSVDAPEVRIWRRLCDAGFATVPLRELLMRRHRVGRRRQMEALLAEEVSARRLARFVETLPPRRRESGVVLVSCLGVGPS